MLVLGMNTWLFAENEFNRNVDESNNFKYFVIDNKKLNKRKILTGDYLITYVTKIMKVTDVRKIISNQPKPIPPSIKYDRNFDCYLETELVKKLNKEDWIDRKSVFPKLSIFENKIINLVLLSAPIKLDQKDSSIIFELFNMD